MNRPRSKPGESPRLALVVDDEVLIRMFVADELRAAGLKVLEAANADEAIEMLNAVLNVDLLLTDVHMPGRMDGLELAKQVRSLYPGMRIILASNDESAIAIADFEFIAKPFNVARLALLAVKLLSD